MTQLYLEQFASFAANGGRAGPSWLLPLRQAAIDRFGTLGFPTPHDEDWHFTSVSPIAEREFVSARAAAPSAVSSDALKPFLFGSGGWHQLVFVDGRFTPALSTIGALPAGVSVRDLGGAWRGNGTSARLLESHLGKVADFDSQAFTALNTAFVTDGALIDVASGVSVEQPIHVVFVATQGAAGRAMHPRTLIVLGAQSRCTIIESYVSLGDATYFTNAVAEAVLAAGATLEHIKVQRESTSAYHVGTMQVKQARDSHYISFSFATGGALSRTNIYTVLDGPGSGATLNGLYLGTGKQHIDHQTRIEHAQPNCFSREHYKGILDGEAHGVFNGKVFVRPEAQKTDGKQTNNNLLLSERARIDTKPQLEIFADDVKCTHGATVGRLDEVALFYMKSRGLRADTARKLLTYAFAAEVIEGVGVGEVREGLEGLVLRRFGGEETAAV